MKITLEMSTVREEFPMPTVVIDSHCDDMEVDTVIDELIIPALIAAGYHKGSILDSMESVKEGERDAGIHTGDYSP